MREIFGRHGRTINSKARLLSQFNADLETVCWISGEEMLWAGDKGGADALKSIITGDTITLEVKNGPRWEVENRLHLLLTTNTPMRLRPVRMSVAISCSMSATRR
jgi:hypothetical protein